MLVRKSVLPGVTCAIAAAANPTGRLQGRLSSAGPVSFKGPQVTDMLQLAAIGLPGWAAHELQGLMGRAGQDLWSLACLVDRGTYGYLRASNS